jgi:uncharacterized membrane protein YidH (DUF202 family)
MTTRRDPSPGGGAEPGPGREPADDDPELTPGLAQERTSLAWTRTAIAFAALGGVVLKENLVTGLIIVALAPVIWQLGQVTRGGLPGAGDRLPAMAGVGPTRLFLIAVTIAAVALLCLILALFGKSVPGALH